MSKPSSGNESTHLETVLVMQGGGSLGAYECGVYKTLVKHGIKFDIFAGTSIGAVNAAIIVGSKNNDPVKDLEDFWLHISETITSLVLDNSSRAVASSMQAALWGNPNVFIPKWLLPSLDYFFPARWPYIYDHSPLKNTLSNYVDFSKLTKESNNSRLIVTATDIQSGEPVTFDSKVLDLDADHILACTGYPFYGISWTHKDGRYLWDGSLLSNTPLREVINASPHNNKKVYIVNLFPRECWSLPNNLIEGLHRARDIVFTDKTYHNVRMSNVIKKYLELLKEMHDIIEHTELDEKRKAQFKKLEPKYHRYVRERGTIISEIIRIERKEEFPYLFEDADFSIATIKELIKSGEEEAERVLAKSKVNIK